MLLTYCINGWAWKVKVVNYNCGLSVSPSHSLRFWLLYSEIAYTFLTIMSPQWIEFSIIMYCPLSSAKNLHSEVYFYDVNSASPAFIWFGIWRYKYFHTFNFKLLAYLRWDYFFTIHKCDLTRKVFIFYLASWVFAAALRLLSSYSVWASLAAAQGLSCQTKDQICVPCIGKQILNHWTPRGVPQSRSYNWRV